MEMRKVKGAKKDAFAERIEAAHAKIRLLEERKAAAEKLARNKALIAAIGQHILQHPDDAGSFADLLNRLGASRLSGMEERREAAE
jgi:hypothetical protein